MLSQIPLQTYLTMLMMSYTSSANALHILRRGSLKLNPELMEQAKSLQKRIREKDQQELNNELKNQLNNKFTELFSVIKTLNSFEYIREESTKNIVWEDGSTKLYDYPPHCGDEAPVVIFIPSLINRSYILDLSAKRSFLRYLQEQNIHSYLVDWGEPSEDEMHFRLDDYIIGRIDKIIEYVSANSSRKVFLAGYCMGGIMAVSAALRHKDKLQGIALFATPWDFHASGFSRFKLEENTVELLEGIIAKSTSISANIIQAMFYYMHPDLIKQKFDNLFLSLGDETKDMDEFIALEYWVNDGISMTSGVAKECFIDWVHFNKINSGEWLVGGKSVKGSYSSHSKLNGAGKAA
jgi:polyhydroxyalkanoate synthase